MHDSRFRVGGNTGSRRDVVVERGGRPDGDIEHLRGPTGRVSAEDMVRSGRGEGGAGSYRERAREMMRRRVGIDAD
jgi:hypothetical protein